MNYLDDSSSSNISAITSLNLTVCLKTQRVFNGKDQLIIRGLTFRLLETLLLAEQKVVSSAELAVKVWKKTYVSEESIAQRVSLLRKALAGIENNLIESVRSEGYRWVYPVSLCREDQSATLNANILSSQIAKLASARRVFPFFLVTFFLLTLPYYLGTQKLVDAPAASSAKREQAQPALLQKAFAFAQQNTEAGNVIAIDLFSEFLTRSPDNVDARTGLSIAYIERVAKFNGAAYFLDYAYEQIKLLSQSTIPEWQLSRLKGYYFDVRGDIDQAIYFYEKAFSENNTSREAVSASLAYLYVRKGRLFEAMQLNLSALKGQGIYTLLQVSEILYLTEMEPDAKNWAEVAYKLAPNDAFVTIQYARDRLARKQVTEAQQAIVRLHNFGAGTEDSHIFLAMLAMNSMDWPLAEKALVQATKLKPESLYSVSLLYWIRKNKMGIGNEMPPAISLQHPVWPDWYIAKSIVELTNNDFSAAKASIAHAISQGYLNYRYLQHMSVFAPLHGDPEFQSLIDRMVHSVETERTKIRILSLPNPAEVVLEG